MFSQIFTGLALSVMVVALTSCATAVPQALKANDIPEAFSAPMASSVQTWPSSEWWQQSGSPELAELIATAQKENLDVAIAAARVAAAQAQTTIQRSALFPQVSLSPELFRFGGSNILSTSVLSTPGGNPPTSGLNTITQESSTVFGLSLGGAYNMDLWGIVHANARAAKETLKSVQFAQQAVALSVVSNVANNYLSVLALRRRIAIQRENIKAINGILDVIRLRVATGKVSRLDLAREEAQMEAVAAQLPVLQQQEQVALVTLAILLGRAPEKFDIQTKEVDALRAPPIAPGLPSELLLRRPDIASAEANLASAHANLVAARAAFFPQFVITFDGGFASNSLSALFFGSNIAWDIGATFIQTIFDGGNLIGKRNLAAATQRELIAAYRRAVFNGFAQVEISIKLLTSMQEAEGHLVIEAAAAREAFQITQLQYRQGTTDLLAVLQAQQTLFGVEDQLIQTKLARMQSIVQLYQALGGGWRETEAERTQTAVRSLISSGAADNLSAQ